ncbi:MAG: hypothetical protein GWP06_00340 [Actinobacteria bacterium]|nr:hypothetical protein [Actinomycetota bacterium]
MKIVLGGRELNTVSASIKRTMDTGLDEWNCIIPEVDPQIDQELYDLVKPRSFAPSIASIQRDGKKDKKLIIGFKYGTFPTVTNQGSALALRGYSKTFPLTISNPKQPQEFIDSSIRDISRKFQLIFGFFTKFSGAVDSQVNEKFENVKINAQDKVFDFLQDLARQRGILTSSDNDGNLEYLIARTSQKSVGSIVEGKDGVVPITEEFSASFDDTNIFQTYQAVNDSPFAFLLKEPQGISKDSRIKIVSFKTIITNSLIKGAGQKTVDFTRNQTVASGLSMPFEANGWESPNGELWKENTLVDVESNSLFVPNGFTFLIRAVEYREDSSKGETTVLSLVPPSLYTGEAIDEPWA